MRAADLAAPMTGMRALGMLLICCGCAATPTAAPPSSPQSVLTGPWHRVALGATKVSVEAPGDPKSGFLPESSTTYLGEGKEPRFAVSVAPEARLDTWRMHPSSGARVEGPMPQTVCGVTAQLLVLVEPAQAVEVFDPYNHHEVIPSRTIVELSLTRAGVGVLMAWYVESAHRAQFRTAEDRFFASLRCE